MTTTILVIGLFIFAAYLFKGIFARTGIPDVLLLMICGIVIGPLMGWATPAQFGEVGSALATMALVIILFEGGVDLDIKSLKPALSPTLKLSLVTFIFTVAIVTVSGMQFASLALTPALMLGMILGGTSSAVVIPLVQGLKVQGKARTVLILESAITDVLCIVGIVVLLDAAKKGGISAGATVLALTETIVIALAIGAAAAIGWLFLLRAARKLPNGSFASTAICFIVYGCTELMGFSGAIAALCFGIFLANGRRLAVKLGVIRVGRLAAFSTREQMFLQELIFVLKTFFFVFLGISMQLNSQTYLLVGGIIVITVYGIRHVIALYATDSDTPRAYVALTAIMVPKGLAAAVLAGLPLQAGVAGGDAIQGIAYFVVLLSIAATSLMIPLQRVFPFSAAYDRVFSRFGTPVKVEQDNPRV